MSKKKSNSRVINNIDNLNLEIDYDKLVQAIVRANLESENLKKEKIQTNQKVTFKRFRELVWGIIINKKQSNGEMISGLFSIVICSFFNIIAILGVCLMVLGTIGSIITAINFPWSINTVFNNIFGIVLMIIILAIVAMLSLLCRASANEISVETDRNYIIDVFSGVVSFVALIVSLVALIKGVG